MRVTMVLPTNMENKIATIKLFRYVADIGLKDAKELAEAHIPYRPYGDPAKSPVELTISMTPLGYRRLLDTLNSTADNSFQEFRIVKVEHEEGDKAYVPVPLTLQNLEMLIEDARIALESLDHQVDLYNRNMSTVPTGITVAQAHAFSLHRKLLDLQLDLRSGANMPTS